MDFLISYSQEKIEKKSQLASNCDLKLTIDHDIITYTGYFDTDYKRYGEKKHIRHEHELTINISTGDIEVSYRLNNETPNSEFFFRETDKKTKNNFKSLDYLCKYGIQRGEKKINYWGVKYRNVTDKIFNKIYNLLSPHFKLDYIKNKWFNDIQYGPLYVLLTDFHLEKKGIKGHNNVYYDIKSEYPKKKWLLKNDNKFLPSVLDSYGIKSKYLIGELNKDNSQNLNISSINYFCKLFGDNYVEYFKTRPWKEYCFVLTPNKKTHTLLNENEKKCLITLITKSIDNKLPSNLLYILNRLFTIRDQLTPLGYDLKFNAKNEFDLENLLETWVSYRNYVNRGYKWRYSIDDEFKNMIESDIVTDGSVFKPKLILTEDDFKFEGLIMKNCMSKQFTNGSIYLFISLKINNKRINLQYKKGSLIQVYGKANTEPPVLFEDAIIELTKRFKENINITWLKEKFDIIKK